MKPIKYATLFILTAGIIGCGGGNSGSSSSAANPSQGRHVDVNLSSEGTYGPITNLSGYDKSSVFIENEVRKIAYIGENLVPYLTSNSSYSSWDEIRQQIMTVNNKVTLKSGLGEFRVESINPQGDYKIVSLRGSNITIALPDRELIETATIPEVFQFLIAQKDVSLHFYIENGSNKRIGYALEYNSPDNIVYSFLKDINNGNNLLYSYTDNKGVHYQIKHDINSQQVTLHDRANSNKIVKTGTYNQSNDTITGL